MSTIRVNNISNLNGSKQDSVDGEDKKFEDWNSAMYPVDVGDVVKLTAQSLKFFPCK